MDRRFPLKPLTTTGAPAAGVPAIVRSPTLAAAHGSGAAARAHRWPTLSIVVPHDRSDERADGIRLLGSVSEVMIATRFCVARADLLAAAERGLGPDLLAMACAFTKDRTDGKARAGAADAQAGAGPGTPVADLFSSLVDSPVHSVWTSHQLGRLALAPLALAITPLALASRINQAIASDQHEELRALLAGLPRATLSARDTFGQNMLHRACLLGASARVLEVLRDSGVERDAFRGDGCTALHLLFMRADATPAQVQALCGTRLPSIDWVDAEGRRALLMLIDRFAALDDDVTHPRDPEVIADLLEMMTCLLEAGAQADIGNEEGMTVGHCFAASLGLTPARADRLRQCGVDPDRRDQAGATVLHQAFTSALMALRRASGAAEIESCLARARGSAQAALSMRPDLNVLDDRGLTPFQALFEDPVALTGVASSVLPWLPQLACFITGITATVARSGYDLNRGVCAHRDRPSMAGNAPLHSLAQRMVAGGVFEAASQELWTTLITHGAKPEQVDSQGRSAMAILGPLAPRAPTTSMASSMSLPTLPSSQKDGVAAKGR